MAHSRNNGNYLFTEGDIFAVVEHRKKQVETEIAAMDRNRILNSSIEDLSSYIEEKLRLETPVLDEAAAVADQREGQVEVYDTWRVRGEGPMVVAGTVVELTVPFSGDEQLFRVRPTTFSSVAPRAEVRGNALVFSVSGRDMRPEDVRKAFDDQCKMVREYLGWQRNSTEPFNAGLRQMAHGMIERRRQKLLSDQNLVAGLGFPLRPRDDAPRTYSAPVKRRRIEPSMPPTGQAPYKPEPVLDEAEYQRILDVMTNMALVMERSPNAFGAIDEEDLRQHFLVQLNGQYEGQATGETFNFQGKTDILIRHEGRNIFIAECKYWHGEKGFAETIDQLLSYLSWRDTKTAIVVFNRNRGFSKVVDRIKEAAAAHPLFKAGPMVEGESRLRFVFGQKDDPSREVIVTVLAFDIPAPGKAIA